MKVNTVDSTWLSRDGFRLGGGYHCSSGQKALRNLANSKSKTQRLQDICHDIFIPHRFKRPYVDNPVYGLPYITGSTMLLSRPQDATTYLSRELTPNVNNLLLRKETILVTCSGIIGRTVLVNDDLAGCIGSPDLLRIIPDNSKINLGFLYAYLSSPVGQSLMIMQTYGSVVDHIEAHHVYDLPIPILGRILEDTLHRKSIKAWEKREQANQFLDQAQLLLHQSLGLPPLNETKSSTINKTTIFNLGTSQLDLRLDASFYNPPGREAIRILEARPDCRLLGDVTERIFHPFRMNMVLVDKDFGVPFLGGGDIVQMRYFGDKYISHVTDHYEDYLLDRGWTLMTIGGTIGNITYVGDYLNGWAASQHVTRIVPDETQLLPGYLYAYMNSDYAQHQVMNLIYGSVVDTIRESQLIGLRIPVPSPQIQQPIHEKVEEAYRLRYEANQLEDETQDLLLKELNLK